LSLVRLKSSAAYFKPGDDRAEVVRLVFPASPDVVLCLVCAEVNTFGELSPGSPDSGESVAAIAGSNGQWLQKNRRGRAASWTERIAAASLDIFGETGHDRQSRFEQ